MKTLEIYKTRLGGFRWRVRAGNGKINDASTQSYAQFRGCRRNMIVNGHTPPDAWPRGAQRAKRSRAGIWSFSS